MKIKITSDCFRRGGVAVSAGDVLECDQDEATDLISSGRAVRAPAVEPEPELPASDPAQEPEATAEPEPKAKAKK